MPLLFDDDYLKLKEWCIAFDEGESQRIFVFKDYQLPANIYTIPSCDVLVMIPPNYNQAGNDMFWTHPRPYRLDGRLIPAVMEPGGGDSRNWRNREFCRWSRHWPPSSWKPGTDNITSIYRRVDSALRNPGP